MFEELIRAANRLERSVQVPVHFETDPDGYMDQVCPSARCGFKFKIHIYDRNEKVGGNAMFCPLCGHTDSHLEWFTPEQQEHIGETGHVRVGRQLNRAMKADARRFNQQQPKDGFIHMHMSVEGQWKPLPLPPAATVPMQMKITCSQCSCRYAVIGAAFFCPACGHNDVRQMFHSSSDRCLGTLEQIPKLQAETSDRDAAKNMTDALIEHALQSAVTAFQKYAETLYQSFLKDPEISQNVFQRLAEGSSLWQTVTGKRYSDYLSESELGVLNLAFQQRHLFAHNHGMVDQKYLDRGGDTSYQLGQRIVLQEKHVREYINLIRKLASSMEETVQENTAGH